MELYQVYTPYEVLIATTHAESAEEAMNKIAKLGWNVGFAQKVIR